MFDVTDQLTSYFEAVVERVTAEDVLKRSTHLDLRPVSRPRWSARPFLVFTATAVTVIVLIGGVGWLIGRRTAPGPDQHPAALGPPPILQTSEGTPTDTGTIRISIRDWAGVEGYKLLAGVSTEEGELGGGAFWTLIDSDPFSATDMFHPALDLNPRSDALEWGAEDYAWDEVARLEPGVYTITFWANPGVLHPYGSHIPAWPVERSCTVDVEVIAGEMSTVVISGIPVGVLEPCPNP